jgi:hypothetical protein
MRTTIRTVYAETGHTRQPEIEIHPIVASINVPHKGLRKRPNPAIFGKPDVRAANAIWLELPACLQVCFRVGLEVSICFFVRFGLVQRICAGRYFCKKIIGNAMTASQL